MKRTAAVVALVFVAAVGAAAQQPEAEKVAQNLLIALSKGEFPGARCLFDDRMRETMPESKLMETFSGLVAKAGRFEYLGPPRSEKAGGAQVVSILCVFEKGAYDAKVGVDEKGRVSGLDFLPAASPSLEEELKPMPALFREREVTVGEGEWSLPGTLTMPAQAGPCPAVVLIHGDGPRDRDEIVGPNRPSRDLAWGLAARGIAVLRYEKRTKEHRRALDKVGDRMTVDDETVDDALAAAKLLRGARGIDPKKVFLLGQSLGGMLAPRIAARDKGIAGLILVSAASRPLEDVILSRTEYFLTLRGEPTEDEKSQLERLKAQVARVKDRSLSEDIPSGELPQGLPASYWLSLRGYDPPAEAKKLNRPILIMQGGRDYNSTSEDFEGWKKALGSRGDVQFRWYPNLNHLFVSGQGKSTPEEFLQRRRSFEDKVLDEIAAWVMTR